MRRVNSNTRRSAVRERRGAALLLTLVAIAVLAVLSTGAILGSMQEFRAGRNALVEQRAMSVAEYGLNQQLSNWSPARNAMSIGAIDSSAVVVESGDTARVHVTRIKRDLYSITSVGRASIGTGQLEAQRSAQLLVRVASPSFNANAAIVTASDFSFKGSADVTGVNTQPFGWSDCDEYGTANAPAIEYDDQASLSIQKPQAVVNGTQVNSSIDPANFLNWGTESFATLAAKANVITNGSSPSPVGTLTTCSYSNTNWGEPNRGLLTVAGCYDYFPIIYSPGDLHINGGRGQGILLVNGKLKVNGNFKFYGIIIVKDVVDKANGGFELHGALLLGGNGGVNEQDINGNASFKYSRCAVEKAKASLSAPVRTRQRSWAPLY